ncbi:family 43 glycosylhydrolase, partial [Streptomyces sp. NPDC093093]|uniref:family 43 glycosylhydrolase n=1 Tax=Streptomyces sp. NPDC093093 TaxID=3366025 RepID=UPI003827BA9F
AFFFPMLSMMNIILPGPKPLISDVRQSGSSPLLGSGFINGSRQSLVIAPLGNPYTLSGPFRVISSPTLSWETQGGSVNEGPEPLYHEGRTFLSYSASNCNTPDYKLGRLELTGADPLSAASWTKAPAPVFQRSDAAGVYGPGHNGFFTSPDGTGNWLLYHANDTTAGGCDNKRTTRAQKFTWRPDGTPDFGTRLQEQRHLPPGIAAPRPRPPPSGRVGGDLNRSSGAVPSKWSCRPPCTCCPSGG